MSPRPPLSVDTPRGDFAVTRIRPRQPCRRNITPNGIARLGLCASMNAEQVQNDLKEMCAKFGPQRAAHKYILFYLSTLKANFYVPFEMFLYKQDLNSA